MNTKPIEFGDETPGTILHDFQAMLNIIGPEGLRIAGEKGLFPMDRLVELDARLAAPLRPSLKRRQLRSYGVAFERSMAKANHRNSIQR